MENDFKGKILENKSEDISDVCLSHEETKRFYQIMLKWEENNLIDYSLMKGADYIQRTLARRLGIEYKPK
jgi:hypothetical protein